MDGSRGKMNMLSFSDSFEVEIVDTELSGMNELHGEYIAVITPSRMSLLDPDDNDTMVLSWPLTQIRLHSSPQNNWIALVMGK